MAQPIISQGLLARAYGDDDGHRRVSIFLRVRMIADTQEADPVERAAFRKKQRRLNVWRLIFVDEFGIHRARSRIDARAPRGERARVKEPSERGSNISVISALRLSGMGATMMIEGAVDTQVWNLYIEHFL